MFMNFCPAFGMFYWISASYLLHCTGEHRWRFRVSHILRSPFVVIATAANLSFLFMLFIAYDIVWISTFRAIANPPGQSISNDKFWLRVSSLSLGGTRSYFSLNCKVCEIRKIHIWLCLYYLIRLLTTKIITVECVSSYINVRYSRVSSSIVSVLPELVL